MKIFLNGEVREIASEMSLAQLLTFFDFPERRIAVELNREVVRKAEWTEKTVGEDDKIEVIHFVGGG
jgi:thiamine biosynthesis protein ThiS